MSRVLGFGVVFGGVGLAASLGALGLLGSHRRTLRTLVSTTGKVVDVIASDVDGQEMFQPVVEFEAGGRTLRAIDDTFHGTSSWKPGDPHVVYYDPRAPETNQLSRETGSLFGAQLLGGIGAALFVVGALALVSLAVGGEFGAWFERALD